MVKYASDKYILDIVSLNLDHTEPNRKSFEYPKTCHRNAKAFAEKIYHKAEIKTGPNYFSNLLTEKKNDATYRAILNLKSLNEECFTKYFKMPCFNIRHISISNPFYFVSVCIFHRRFLKFIHEREELQFNVMSNAYIDAMRLLNKMSKAPLHI